MCAPRAPVISMAAATTASKNPSVSDSETSRALRSRNRCVSRRSLATACSARARSSRGTSRFVTSRNSSTSSCRQACGRLSHTANSNLHAPSRANGTVMNEPMSNPAYASPSVLASVKVSFTTIVSPLRATRRNSSETNAEMGRVSARVVIPSRRPDVIGAKLVA